MPRVSVIIPTYNYADSLAKAIKSVLAQTYRDFELIVVDDGSTDSTRSVVESFGDRVCYVYQDNRGQASAKNLGIRLAQGEYIAFLDSDDLWLPQKLELQVPVLDARPNVGLVYSDLYFVDGETGRLLGQYERYGRLHSGHVLRELFEYNFIQSPTPVVRQSVFETVGYFDEQLSPCDDWDMWLRIAVRYQVAVVNQPLAQHRLHAQSVSANIERKYTETLLVLNKVLATRPELAEQLGRNKLRKFADVEVEFGRGLLARGHVAKARHRFVRALQLDPTLLAPWLYLAATFLGRSFLVWGISWYHKRHSRGPCEAISQWTP